MNYSSLSPDGESKSKLLTRKGKKESNS
jgi:hypothetical protein